MTLPDQLTLARALAVPVVVVLFAWNFPNHNYWATAVFVVAMSTDQIDGWLARRWQVESDFGRVADPLADRLMIDAAVILLVLVHHRLPWIALALIIARDALLIGGYKLLMPHGYELNVNFLGKAATWLLYASLAFVMVTSEGTRWPLWIFWTGVALALAAGALYLRSAWKMMRR